MSDDHIKIQKQKARDLRHSRWWQQKIYNGTCYYCHIQLNSKTATMDHIIPLSRGGISAKNNIVVCCKECNNKKKNDLPF